MLHCLGISWSGNILPENKPFIRKKMFFFSLKRLSLLALGYYQMKLNLFNLCIRTLSSDFHLAVNFCGSFFLFYLFSLPLRKVGRRGVISVKVSIKKARTILKSEQPMPNHQVCTESAQSYGSDVSGH